MGVPDRDPAVLFEAARAGDRAALGQLLTVVERAGSGARVAASLVAASGLVGRAHVVGITGAPGAGKSTLTDGLVRHLRARGIAVAVVAVDPTSPYTGGAVLGDRVRMHGHAGDDGVVVRSMASRGDRGGLADAVPEVLRVLDTAGFPVVILETVGVGQVELAVAGAADTTVVVVNPGWGDGMQASKAGILEIADVLCVNKADRPGAEAAVSDLRRALDLGAGRPDQPGWETPVVSTIASQRGESAGIARLAAAIDAHRAFVTERGLLTPRRAVRARDELTRLVARRLEAAARSRLGEAGLAALVDDVVAGRLDPRVAADRMVPAAS